MKPLSLETCTRGHLPSWGRIQTSIVIVLLLIALMACEALAQPGIRSYTRSGVIEISNAFVNGVCTIEQASSVTGPWLPSTNLFTTSGVASASLASASSAGFGRLRGWDISAGRPGFTNLTRAYGLLTTVAGAGGIQNVNNWRPEFEGAPATNVFLSGPHIALADRAGNIYIADKDAHGIRQVRPDGTIRTVAGTNAAGNGTDEPSPATEVALNGPNGLWVRGDGTVFILDTGNGKVRRLDTNGVSRTLFTDPSGISIGRGLWVSDDEACAYYCSLTVVREWTSSGGTRDLATGFVELGNLAIDPDGRVVVTDRSTHLVYRLDSNGNRTIIAGNGGTSGGGDGQLATSTSVRGVRGVWFLPSGAYFLATHRGSQVWYVDTAGFIHLWINGDHYGAHAGDGTWFYRPTEARVQDCRSVTMDFEGNLLITENDLGYVRKVRFLPMPE